MKLNRRIQLSFILAALACAGAHGRPPTKQKAAPLPQLAKHLIEMLAQGKYDELAGHFDQTVKAALPEDKLAAVWAQLTSSVGEFVGVEGLRESSEGGYTVVVLNCKFSKASLDAKFSFDKRRRVAGLLFLPPQPTSEYTPPAYVKRDAFREREVQVGGGEWVLPGALAIPQGPGPFPAVVLVHGSGPHDRDETIGPNKPFRDLAWGLASRNVAVLRYEKRTRTYSTKIARAMGNFTVMEETVDDALAAVAHLRKRARIDSKRIFVLGHSLGGTLIPRIGRRDSNIAGFIVMAGLTRPLEDAIVQQTIYISSLDGLISEDETARIEQLRRQADRVKDPKLSADTPPEDLPFNVAPAYWLDLRGYEPHELAKELRQPMLILQGGRDYQVTSVDFGHWKQSLDGRPNVVLRNYPKLNHLFIEGAGRSTPAEYNIAGHVAAEVIADIAEWIDK